MLPYSAVLATLTTRFSQMDLAIIEGEARQDSTSLHWKEFILSNAISQGLKDFLAENPQWGEQVMLEREKILKMGVRWTYPNCPDYPQALLEIERPPGLLTYFGHPVWKTSRLISLVGSREPTHESLKWIEFNMRPLVEQGIAVVSGGARGIDLYAHQMTLDLGGKTVVCLPSGLGNPYPSLWREFSQRVIASGGAVLSEYPIEMPMRKFHFDQRNRIIAGLSKVVVIVQAARKSGSLMTAFRALQNNRSVAVVPGSPMNNEYAGSLDLLADGAHLIRDTGDLNALMALTFTK